ncbi:MAG TPA: hypothetical protein VEX86_09210 [Longimicrobium sp.]|nr:hypothetical protein [Longimicrobium sp.]
MQFDVSPTGAVEPDGIHVLLTTDPAFEEATVAIVRRLRFHPGRLLRNGSAVESWVTMPLHFGQVLAAG